MEPTTLTLHSAFQIDEVDPRIFGGFLEHMGRAVYQGVYDPASRHADAQGFRTDVLTALKRLQMTTVRYPGGNFVSGYHWENGVGPREKRPTVRELAWNTIGVGPHARRESRDGNARGGLQLGAVLQRRAGNEIR
jgi:alpha-N-arabinofuranosidase